MQSDQCRNAETLAAGRASGKWFVLREILSAMERVLLKTEKIDFFCDIHYLLHQMFIVIYYIRKRKIFQQNGQMKVCMKRIGLDLEAVDGQS